LLANKSEFWIVYKLISFMVMIFDPIVIIFGNKLCF